MLKLLATAFALAAVPIASTPRHPFETNPFGCANALLLPKGEYLAAAELLSEAANGEANPAGPLHQFRNVAVSFVTDRADDPPTSPAAANKSDLHKLTRARLRDALREIAKRARRTSIVILNEEHQEPRDRAFALQVARMLRPLGYSILAVEAFHSAPDAAERAREAELIAEDGYVRLDTGVYSKDPVFADFVRQSLALGYRPVVYDFVTQKGAPRAFEQREQGAADNLMSAVFANSSRAKVLIYVGYSHATEEPVDGMSWLAARLKRMTAIDPLTIDQTTLSPSAVSSNDRGLYAALRPRMERRSVVPMLDGNPVKFGDLGPAVDLQVAHPPARLIRGRPDWLVAMDRTAVEVPLSLRPRTGRVLLQAFLANEAADAIPVDQVIVTAGHKPPPLLVPKGRLRFAVKLGYRPGDCSAPNESMRGASPAATR